MRGTVDAAGNTYVPGCGPHPGAPTLVFDRSRQLIAEWPGSTYRLLRSTVFGPGGEVFALASDGSIFRLRITLAGACHGAHDGGSPLTLTHSPGRGTPGSSTISTEVRTPVIQAPAGHAGVSTTPAWEISVLARS